MQLIGCHQQLRTVSINKQDAVAGSGRQRQAAAVGPSASRYQLAAAVCSQPRARHMRTTCINEQHGARCMKSADKESAPSTVAAPIALSSAWLPPLLHAPSGSTQGPAGGRSTGRWQLHDALR
jgi:hypothetical protein